MHSAKLATAGETAAGTAESAVFGYATLVTPRATASFCGMLGGSTEKSSYINSSLHLPPAPLPPLRSPFPTSFLFLLTTTTPRSPLPPPQPFSPLPPLAPPPNPSHHSTPSSPSPFSPLPHLVSLLPPSPLLHTTFTIPDHLQTNMHDIISEE